MYIKRMLPYQHLYNYYGQKSRCSCKKKCRKCSRSYLDPYYLCFNMHPQIMRNPEICVKMREPVVVTWKINYLVSNTPNQAAHMDADLINPWGIIVYKSQLWVSNNTSDKITNYDLFGNKLLGSIVIRDSTHNSSNPTGIVINCDNGFTISNDLLTRSSQFLVSTEHGTVHGYNYNIDPLGSSVVINEQLSGNITVYKGLAIVNNTLYLANFFKRTIDVFDSNYNRLTGYSFVDTYSVDPIPQDFSPHNIVNIGCYLYVLWARKDPVNTLQHIPGSGYISIFNLDGSFVKRFASKGVLNSPWAMIPAPYECGIPPNSFLVGNRGDGRINVFDCNGCFVGPLLNQNGFPIVIDGLNGLAPYYTSNHSEIFFTSSIKESKNGLLGSIEVDRFVNI